MDRVDGYRLDLGGMTEDAVSHRWQLTDDFFAAVNGREIGKGQVDVALRVKRTSEAFELEFGFDGVVEVECDRCLGRMNQPVHGETVLHVRLDDEDGDDGELITVARVPGILDLSWHMYEMVALGIPLRHVHPDGECDAAIVQRLDGEGQERQTDSRWDALKELITKTNK
ncbi:MAG: DUF177 domain-containing protein [Bacteroidaceae bacterium]|nr:DUF177 domain-containing protein [Bacteroidaceae bacterium]